jgi:hypothetical protein
MHNDQIRLADKSEQPQPSYNSAFTPHPNEIGHSSYDLFSNQQQQQSPHEKPPDNHNEICPNHNLNQQPIQASSTKITTTTIAPRTVRVCLSKNGRSSFMIMVVMIRL